MRRFEIIPNRYTTVVKTESYRIKLASCVKVIKRKRTKRKCHSKVSSLKAEILIYFIKMGLKCSVKVHAQRKAVILKKKN